MNLELQIILVAIVVSFACLIPGTFLVLKKIAMLSDAISHSVILGIVISFFWFQDLHSPFLFLGATLTGLVMVYLTEKIITTKKIKREAVIALVFPLLFSLAIILINLFASDIHLDEDVVITGELAFTPLVPFKISETIQIPKALVVSGANLIINLILFFLFYKELTLASFDEGYFTSLGFHHKKINYGLVFITSLTAVCSFEAVGSILVVGFFILPPSISLLWTKKMKSMIMISFIISLFSIIISYFLSYLFNFSIAGTILIVLGILLIISTFIAPKSSRIKKKVTLNH